MEEFWALILVLFFATNSLDKAESVQLEETPLEIFDEIFGEGWWDYGKAKEWHKLTLEQNFHDEIDRQNTQPGQIEPNSNDQLGQIEPNSTDQNTPLTESDHSDNAKNGEQLSVEDERKRKIIAKFHAMKGEFKQKGNFSAKEWNQIEEKIAKHLKVSRSKIYKWKNELGQSRKIFYEKEERKHLIEKFDQMKAELKRNGFKNSHQNKINETVAKKLGLNFTTIYRWKRKLGQSVTNFSDNEKFEIVKKLMQMKSDNSGKDKKSCKEIDKEIAERFGVNVCTLNQWKKEFGLTQRNPKNERKNLVEKFDQRKAELMRAGLKNSYKNEIDETAAKELGLNFTTIYAWKRELGQTKPNKHSHSEQKELMNRYYKIKCQNPKISNENIAKMLNIGLRTLFRWKKQFKRQQFHPNSVDGHFVEENAAENVQEIGHSNSES